MIRPVGLNRNLQTVGMHAQSREWAIERSLCIARIYMNRSHSNKDRIDILRIKLYIKKQIQNATVNRQQ